MSRRATIALLTALVGGACSPETPTAPADLAAPSFAAKGGGGGTPTYPQANLVWEDAVGTTAAAVLGDGRNATGGTDGTVDAYEGGHCGVWTIIYNQKKDGDGLLAFDPDTYFDTNGCGPRRTLSLDFGNQNGRNLGVVVAGPKLEVSGIWAIGVGGAVDAAAQLGMQGAGPGCILTFDPAYFGAEAVGVQRLDGGTGPRQWRVHSQGGHTAACVALNARGRLVDTGERYALPFSVVVTEVP